MYKYIKAAPSTHNQTLSKIHHNTAQRKNITYNTVSFVTVRQIGIKKI